MHANVHLWNKSVTDVAPGNEVSTRKAFIITIHHISNLCRYPHIFKKKYNRYYKAQFIWKGDEWSIVCSIWGTTHTCSEKLISLHLHLISRKAFAWCLNSSLKAVQVFQILILKTVLCHECLWKSNPFLMAYLFLETRWMSISFL